MGRPVRYDGQSVSDLGATLAEMLPRARLVTLCPEMAGGLPTPRPPAEITPEHDGGDVLARRAKVVTAAGDDVSHAFLTGAQAALDLAQSQSCTFALLKESSPSCGVSLLHAGHFDGTKRAASGVTATLLRRAGLAVYTEHQIADLARAVKTAL